MSAPADPIRLEWDGRTGLARHDGVCIELRQAPSSAWCEVHFTPGTQAEVRERAGDPRRDMRPEEIQMTLRWLEHMSYAARACLGHSTKRDL